MFNCNNAYKSRIFQIKMNNKFKKSILGLAGIIGLTGFISGWSAHKIVEYRANNYAEIGVLKEKDYGHRLKEGIS